MLFANQTRLIIGCPNNCIGIASYSSSTWTWFAYFGLLGASIGALFHFNTSGYFFFECMKSISLQLSVLFLFLSWAESTYEKQGCVNTTLQLQKIIKYAVNEIICVSSFFFTLFFFFFENALMRTASLLQCSLYTSSDALHSQKLILVGFAIRKQFSSQLSKMYLPKLVFTYFYSVVNLMVNRTSQFGRSLLSLSLSAVQVNVLLVDWGSFRALLPLLDQLDNRAPCND